jgi:diguanylate cyclase (GGDEF)-like protein
MTFRELPVAARLHIGLVIFAGVVGCVWSVFAGAFAQPLVLVMLILASVAAHTLKTDLPFSTSLSTLSIGYTVCFGALLAFGPAVTVWAMASGALAQCTLNVKERNPWYRTVFSMSTLTLSMLSASATLTLTGGRSLNGAADVVVPSIVASALVYFVVNTTLLALAIGLSTRRSPIEIWDREFIWGAPNYFFGAVAATVAIQGLNRFGVKSVVLFILPIFLTYRLYKVYLARMDDIARANRELHVEMERARTESVTDPLTQLPNRRFLANHTLQEIARADRQRESFAFIMIDLDDLKAINDTFGHQKGDEALTLVASCLRRALRSYDVCCRYAGDEFAVVLSNCSRELAGRRAEAITAAVGALEFKMAAACALPLSASAGVAIFPEDGRTYHELMAAADARMYEHKASKDSRRSRTVPEAVPSGSQSPD